MKTYQTKIEIDIIPEYHSGDPPVINYGIDTPDISLAIEKPMTLILNQELDSNQHRVIIDFVNKKDSDTIPSQNLDKKVIIGQIKFYGFTIPKFNWIAEYYPVFPEPWYSEQNPKPDPCIVGSTVLGWNGRWQLAFETPVFPWIHRIENMGWVWPV